MRNASGPACFILVALFLVPAWTSASDLADPAADAAWARELREALGRGDADAAEAVCRRELASRPNDVEVLIVLGNLLLGSDRGEEAESLFRRVLAAQPGHPDGLNNLGIALIRRGRSAEGVELLRSCTEAHPDYEQAWFNLGEFFYKAAPSQPYVIGQGRPDNSATSARPFLERSVELNPRRWEAHLYLADIAHWQHDVPRAAAHYQAVLDGRGDDPQTYLRLGVLYMDHGMLEAALVEFGNALMLDESSAEAWYGKGAALLAAGRRDDAEEALRKALSLDPAHVRAMADLALAVQSLGTPRAYGEARKLYEQAIAVDPSFLRARYNLAVLLESMSEPEAAASAYADVLELRPEHAMAANNLGTIHHEAGRYAAAIRVYERALLHTPGSPPLRFNLALALLAAGEERDRALELLGELAQAAKEGDPYGLRAREVLADLGRPR